MNEMMMQQALQQAADSGRATDTTLAHLTLGEVVIPREIMEDPEVQQVVQAVFEAYGVDMREFTVGDPANKINPETGYPEFFFKKIKRFFKKIAPIALPILGTMIPGVGPILGGALGGAAGGLVSGGGLKAALTGGVLGGAGGALTGGASGLLGHAAGTPLSGVTGNAALQGPTMGTGIRGALTGGGLSALTSGGGGGLGNLGSLARVGGALYGNSEESEANKRARQAMLGATESAKASMQPYNQMGLQAQQQLSDNLSAGFNPSDLTSDPGYQFRLNEGLKQRNASLASMGMSQSGAAIKEAEQYGQGMAATEYGNAYDRWLAQNDRLAGMGGQGMSAAGTMGGLDLNAGNVEAAYRLAQAERKNRTLASILAGLGG